MGVLRAVYWLPLAAALIPHATTAPAAIEWHYPIDPPRQIIVAQPVTTAPTPDVALPKQYDVDVDTQLTEFGDRELTQLLAEGDLTLTLPDGNALHLALQAVRHTHGTLHIRASSGPWVSTITRRGPRFFATIASRDEVYRVQGAGQMSHWTAHRSLQYREMEQDYRDAL